ncbi:MAG: DUF3999 domain-containing protein [Campylobacteraceae bacterium]|jgi:hypothetical protein|nr:DUF3999 domain-containing protein [Campylobacteraceae bacterium]
MYKKIVSILAFASCLAAQSSYDYAYGLNIDSNNAFTLNKISLPDEVYLRSLSPSLDDVAVFNKNNQLVAFSLIDAKTTENITLEMDATLYLVNEKKSNTTQGDERYTYTYLAKLPKDAKYPSYFKLAWESAEYNWEARVSIKIQLLDGYETTAASGVLLSELKDISDESRLKADEVPIHDYSYYSADEIRGWQFVITSDKKIPKITAIKAYAKEQFTDQSFVGIDAEYEMQNDGSIICKLPTIQPVEQVYIGLTQANLILPITLFYKNSEDKWTKLDGRIISEEADIEFSRIVFAKEFMLKTNGGFSDIPKFTAYRKRVDIIFNSANNAPFVLAYGSFDAKPLGLPSVELLKDADIDYMPTVGTGSFIMLGGEKALEAKIEKSENFVPTWAIWAALVLGAAFLIFLAYKLGKEIKTV